MEKYYDEKCFQCDGCYHHKYGEFPNGTPYEACSKYGYILHLEKGIKDVGCGGFVTPAQWAVNQRLRERQKIKTKR